MKVSINSPIVSIRTELSEEQLLSLIETALSLVGKKPEIPVPVLPPLQTGGILPKKSKEINEAVKKTLEGSGDTCIHLNGVPITPDSPAKVEFKGFLYLQCEECKKFKGFMPKTPISKYHCDCGHTTPLKDMRVMRVDCKCGTKFKYLTNATDSVISIDCYNCGSPVDLEYHERKQEYVTIGSE